LWVKRRELARRQASVFPSPSTYTRDNRTVDRQSSLDNPVKGIFDPPGAERPASDDKETFVKQPRRRARPPAA
jgi:hypothetical protein